MVWYIVERPNSCFFNFLRLKVPDQNSLRDAKLGFKDLDEVILVGGFTRIPAVQELVKSLTDKDPNVTVNPDEVVALGAAVQVSDLFVSAYKFWSASTSATVGAFLHLLRELKWVDRLHKWCERRFLVVLSTPTPTTSTTTASPTSYSTLLSTVGYVMKVHLTAMISMFK